MQPPLFNHLTPKSERHRQGVACDPSEDRARQEFKSETDTLTLLKRYGAGIPLRQVQFGEAFTDVDRLTAISQVDSLQEAFTALPEHLRQKFGSWQDLVSAISRGELTTLEPPAPVEESQA